MPLDVDDVLQLLAQLADDTELRVTVKESLKGGVITGAAAVIGGVLLGPPGLAIGKYAIIIISTFYSQSSSLNIHLFFYNLINY